MKNVSVFSSVKRMEEDDHTPRENVLDRELMLGGTKATPMLKTTAIEKTDKIHTYDPKEDQNESLPWKH